MSDSKYVQGPWNYFVGNANGRGLIRIEQDGTGVHIASMPRGEVSEANACLIAAAPELLDVVLALVAETVEYATINKLGDPEKQHNIKWARQVIAKAGG